MVLHNIRSTYNVGAILRTAEGLGVKRVILSGWTPRVDDERVLPHLREKLNHQIGKTALGAEKMVELENCEDLVSRLRGMRKAGALVAGLENNIQDARKIPLGEFRGFWKSRKSRSALDFEDSRVLPDLPLLVVIMITPKEARAP